MGKLQKTCIRTISNLLSSTISANKIPSLSFTEIGSPEALSVGMDSMAIPIRSQHPAPVTRQNYASRL